MGLHAAVELARRGVHVVATLRDPAKSERLRAAGSAAGVELDVRRLDVVDHSAAAALIGEVEEEFGGIDILVNNAGRGMVASAEQASMAQIREQMDVNYFAPVNLTKAVLPGMRERGAGSIFTVTSVGGAVGQPFADAYCGSKFAVEGFMQSLAVVAERLGVRVSVIEPAAVASDFVANAARPDAAGPYTPLLDAYIRRSSVAFANAQSEESAGVAIADAVLSDDYRFRWQSSDGATAFVSASLADTDGSRVLGLTRPWIGEA